MQSYKRRLDTKTLFGKGNHDIFSYLPAAPAHFFTNSVRGGLKAIIESLKIPPGSKVMLPAWVAEGIIDPFRKKKMEVVFYNSLPNLSPDLENIAGLIKTESGIRFIVIIHYFGFPQRLDEIMHLCRASGILVLEDCVHSMFSRNEDGLLTGSTGDIAFFSLPKILPVPDGGLFLIHNPELTYLTEKVKYRRTLAGSLLVYFHLLFLLVKSWEVKLGYSIFYRFVNLFSKGLYTTYYFILQRSFQPQPVSEITKKILKNIDYEQLIATRRRNIEKIYHAPMPGNIDFFSRKFHPNNLLNGVPCIIRGNRKSYLRHLKTRGIECQVYEKSWDFFPNGAGNRFAPEHFLFNNLFLFPVIGELTLPPSPEGINAQAN